MDAIFVNIDWDGRYQSLVDFEKINLESNLLMKRGIVFVWTPKQKLADVVRIMERKKYFYA